MLLRGPFPRKATAATLFLLSLLFFLERGPYRALRYSRTGDFATIYAASRCWMHGEDPYARADLTLELVRSGAPAPLILDQDRHSSLYPLTAMPFVAPFALLPWAAANTTWCLFSLGCFAASLAALLRELRISQAGKWVAASVCLLFSPTYVGILNGNPSVFAISLTILSVHFVLRKRPLIAGILFAVTICVKPQIALCAFLAFLLWKCWKPLFMGLATATLVAISAIFQASALGQNWEWWGSLKQNLRSEALPGGLVDPRPSSPFAPQLLNAQTLSYLVTRNSQLAEGLVLFFAIGMVALYWYARKKDSTPEGRIDLAFLSAITLMVAYHRYYDGQLLLVLIPAAVCLWQTGRVKTASGLGVSFALMAFPFQSVSEKAFGPAAAQNYLMQLILFRHEPIAIVAVALILTLRWRRILLP